MNVFQKIKVYISSKKIISTIEETKNLISILQNGTIDERKFKKCALEALIQTINDDEPELIDELYEELFGKENIDG